MPIYEYECDACGKRFEQIQKFADTPLEVCTLCGKGPVRRLLSAPAFQFKGSGWYITDYAKKGSDSDTSDKAAKPEKKSDAGEPAATSPAEKAQTKPAAESKPVSTSTSKDS